MRATKVSKTCNKKLEKPLDKLLKIKYNKDTEKQKNKF